ncbi:Ribose transport system permease protein RbsC [Roseisalinus antarcticus]|uniref:Autoinducer 2 import system permease protein LsrD n=1 Tax=Roseisalinus antarcticus TaxID=254357 RepID=A0A1Y5RWB6_9RHOB|nr:Ribose transport system permease protein RbsC [Roseisalinus antarcticus]
MRQQAVGRVLRSFGAVWIAVVLLYGISGLISPSMFQLSQVVNILQVASFLGVIALGQVIVILTGGIDLSQAGLITLTNIVATSLMLGQPENIPLAVAVCLVLALLVGLLNGVLVVVVGITPLVATLGVNSILFGAALVYTGGAPRGEAAAAFELLGTGKLLGIPAPTLIWIALAALLFVLTRLTVFGRWLYATGANPVAAKLMGVPVERVTVGAYGLSALMAAFGGLLLTAYIGSPSLGIGNQFLLTSVAAVVVGGAALTGGIGGVLATVGGAIFITELNSFTNIVRVSTGTQFVLQGAIIVLSVIAYRRLSGPAR